MISDKENVTAVTKKGQSQYPLVTGEAAVLASRPRYPLQGLCVAGYVENDSSLAGGEVGVIIPDGPNSQGRPPTERQLEERARRENAYSPFRKVFGHLAPRHIPRCPNTIRISEYSDEHHPTGGSGRSNRRRSQIAKFEPILEDLTQRARLPNAQVPMRRKRRRGLRQFHRTQLYEYFIS